MSETTNSNPTHSYSEPAADPKRELLRHILATLAYRGGKAVRHAPAELAEFQAGEGVRTPGQILAHIGDLLDWALSIAKGQQKWQDSKPLQWQQEVERFFATLKKLDEVFDSTPLFTFDDIAEAVIPVYQKNLSAGDVQAGIDFYTSEAGKRLLEKIPVIVRETNESGGQLVQQKLKAYSEELERKLEAFQGQTDSQKPPAASQDKAVDDPSKTTDGKSK